MSRAPTPPHHADHGHLPSASVGVRRSRARWASRSRAPSASCGSRPMPGSASFRARPLQPTPVSLLATRRSPPVCAIRWWPPPSSTRCTGRAATQCGGPVVAAGYRAGLAHSSFNGHVIARGETVFLELTGEYRRYVAPVMRTAIVGSPTAEHRRLAQASADAVAAILEAARAGTPARTVAEAGLRFIRPVERDVVFHYYFGYPVGIGHPP